MDTATKTGMGAAKTASKTVVQKPADLIENKIADKIKLLQQVNQKKKKKQKKFIFHQKKDKLLMILD